MKRFLIRDILRIDLLDEISLLIVGPEKILFGMHKGLLCSVSTYFKAALQGGFKEAEEQRIELPDDDVSVIKRFQLWLYTQKVLEEDETADHLQWSLWVGIYCFAEGRGIPHLQNLVIDCFIDKNKISQMLPSGEICRVYENTPPNSPLRRLLVDISARCGALDTWDLKDQSDSRDMWSEFFMKDLVLALYHETVSKGRDDFKSFRCDYHFHADGEKRCLS